MTVLQRPNPEDADLDASDKIYARAIELAYGPSRRKPMSERVVSALHWGMILAAFGWIFSMVVDRDLPVQIGAREVINAGKKVAAGERLLVRSARRRIRSCELTRRWTIIDGEGRRFDYEPERSDAYGPITPPEAAPEVETAGPVIPLDAMPGRGRWISVLAWDCNPLQRALGWSIVLIQPAVEFEIVRRATP
jgi:hypothetical protein